MRVELSLSVGLAAALVVLGLVLAFAFLPSHRALVIFLSASTGGAATVTSAYYAAKALAATTIQNAEAIKTRKLLAAFEYIQRWNAPPFSETRKHFRALLAQVRGKSGEELWNVLSNDHEKRSVVLDVLNHFEELGLAVKKGILAEEVAKDYFELIVTDYFSVFHGWVEQLRTHHTYRGAYAQLEWLRNR